MNDNPSLKKVTTSQSYEDFVTAVALIQEEFGTTTVVATLAASLVNKLQTAKDKQGALTVIATMMSDIAAMPQGESGIIQ